MTADTSLFLLLHSGAGVSPFFDHLILFGATYLPYALILILAGLLALSAYSQREKIEIFAVTLLSALVARFGVTELIRLFVHRPRPFLTLGLTPLVSETSWSFPSGHAMFFFGMATAVYLYEKRWGLFFYAGAVLVGVSRVVAGVHYPLDILVGALLGALTALGVNYLVTNYYKNR